MKASSHRVSQVGSRPRPVPLGPACCLQAAERQGPGPPLPRPPLLRVPASRGRGRLVHSHPPAPRLRGPAGPGKTEGPKRSLRRHSGACGSGGDGGQPARPGRHGLAPAKRRSSPAAALSASRWRSAPESFPSQPPPGRRTGTRAADRKVPLRACQKPLFPHAGWIATPSSTEPFMLTFPGVNKHKKSQAGNLRMILVGCPTE